MYIHECTCVVNSSWDNDWSGGSSNDVTRLTRAYPAPDPIDLQIFAESFFSAAHGKTLWQLSNQQKSQFEHQSIQFVPFGFSAVRCDCDCDSTIFDLIRFVLMPAASKSNCRRPLWPLPLRAPSVLIKPRNRIVINAMDGLNGCKGIINAVENTSNSTFFPRLELFWLEQRRDEKERLPRIPMKFWSYLI